jgi:hypothetical protein
MEWTTFERECFTPRIAEAAVIPIYLDGTVFPGIPRDIIGINFKPRSSTDEELYNQITDEVIFKLASRLDDA